MRAAIGLIAVLLLAAGLAGLFVREPSGDSLVAASGASLRVGVVMGLWWLAYPQVERIPRWLAVAVGVTLLLVMRWPRLLLVAIPLLAILWFLGPRKPREKPTAG